MGLFEQFTSYIKEHQLFQAKDYLLITVSGGVDSVVLADLCSRAGFSFAIAHCNFNLRGEESDKDELFVRQLAEKYNVPFYVKSFETEKIAEVNHESIQVTARKIRYKWFLQLAQDVRKELDVSTTSPSVYILTAHHLNDSIETMLMNFFKGTGIRGLQGIAPKKGTIIRPLLFAPKEAILKYASHHSISFREDQSNLSDKYTRNYFRNQLIPGIQNVFPMVETNLANNLNRFSEVGMLYDSAIESHKKQVFSKRKNEWVISIKRLEKIKARKTVLYEILKDFGFTPMQVEDALQLTNSLSGKFIQSPEYRLFRNRDVLVISPPGSHDLATFVCIEQEDTLVSFALGKISVSHNVPVPSDFKQKNPNQITIDAAQIDFPLLLRPWKEGDYFYPIGLTKRNSDKRGKKKLSKFLVDQKVSLSDKESVWVLESKKRIVWIIGYRMDDRFKITSSTKSCLSITLNKS